MTVMTTTTKGSPGSRTVASALQMRPVQIGETSDEVGRIAERIRAGEAFLKVVEYPWGVEFEVYCQEGEE